MQVQIQCTNLTASNAVNPMITSKGIGYGLTLGFVTVQHHCEGMARGCSATLRSKDSCLSAATSQKQL